MKWLKYLAILIPIIFSSQVNAGWVKTASEKIIFGVIPPIDTATFHEVEPDSIEVFVYGDTTGAGAYIYSASAVSYSCAGIDTTNNGGSTATINYVQTLSTIVAGKTTGHISIQVVCWKSGMAWRTFSNGQLVTSSRNSLSTLASSDNIGINWGDVSNPGTTLNLSGTTVKDINDINTDSLMNVVTRLGVFQGCICDSTTVKYFPLGSKPKDSALVYCITGGAESIVGRFYFKITNQSVSSSNVVDSSRTVVP